MRMFKMYNLTKNSLTFMKVHGTTMYKALYLILLNQKLNDNKIIFDDSPKFQIDTKLLNFNIQKLRKHDFPTQFTSVKLVDTVDTGRYQ